MGKHIVVIAFVSAFLGAIFVFFQRGEKQAHKMVDKEELGRHKSSRISIEEFVLYEYKDHKSTGTFQGELAQFQDSDTLEILGNVRGNRLNGEQKEVLEADSATARFASKGLSELVANSKVQTVDLENHVRFGSGDISLFSDFARYTQQTGKLVSDRPVRIESTEAHLLGQKGFEYDSKIQDVKVFGPLEGTLVDVQKKP